MLSFHFIHEAHLTLALCALYACAFDTFLAFVWAMAPVVLHELFGVLQFLGVKPVILLIAIAFPFDIVLEDTIDPFVQDNLIQLVLDSCFRI